MSPKDRHQVQALWAQNSIQVIVATIAFGMGIDKPDVRFVIHYSLPKSLEGYYQETGRAGRDGLSSTCILYYAYGDKSKVEFLIDRGEGSYQQKQRQKDNLRDVIQYCENRIDCRRTLILQYFGENFNRIDCRKTCDNCESSGDVVTRDFTDAAKDLLNLLMSIRGKITLIQLVDIFRGSSSKKSLQYDDLPLYGAGRSLSRGDAERLSQTMVTQRILEEYCETNGLGFVSSYVRVAKEADSLLEGKRKVTMIEHVGGESSRKSSETRETSSSRGKRMGSRASSIKTRDIRDAIELVKEMSDGEENYIDDSFDYGALYHVEANDEDHYGDDFIVDDDVYKLDEMENVNDDHEYSRGHTRTNDKRWEGKSDQAPRYVSMDEEDERRQMKCFDELLQLRERICMRTKLSSKFFSNTTIGQLSRHPPADTAALVAITGGGVFVDRNSEAILEITKKYS